MEVYYENEWQQVIIQHYDPETGLYTGLFAGFDWTRTVDLATAQFRLSEARQLRDICFWPFLTHFAALRHPAPPHAL